MRAKIREARENESGFTLIELLIVIVVLGILAAVVVFGVANFKRDAQVSACETTLGTVQSAAAAYRTKYATYPNMAASLTAAGTLNYLVTYPSNASLTFTSTALPSEVSCVE